MTSHFSSSALPRLPCAIHRAAHQGDLRSVLAWLASSDGNPRARNEAGETILSVAVRGLSHRSGEDIDEIAGALVKTLVAAGVPVNAVDSQGRSALHWAALERPSIVMALLSVGAAPDLPGPNGDTPLHTVYLGGSARPQDGAEIAMLLRAMGADGARSNGDGLTPDELMSRLPSSNGVSTDRLMPGGLMPGGLMPGGLMPGGLTSGAATLEPAAVGLDRDQDSGSGAPPDYQSQQATLSGGTTPLPVRARCRA